MMYHDIDSAVSEILATNRQEASIAKQVDIYCQPVNVKIVEQIRNKKVAICVRGLQ